MGGLMGPSRSSEKAAERRAQKASKKAAKAQKQAEARAASALDRLTTIAENPPEIQMPELPKEQPLPSITDPEVAATEKRMRERAKGRGGRASTRLASK